MSSQSTAPVVSGSSVIGAGLASAVAAVLTSRFGVGGTLVGAALTTMIITGGTALLQAYLSSAAAKAKSAPVNIQARVTQNREGRSVAPRRQVRENFFQRLSGALSWFSHAPGRTRRSVIVRWVIGAVIALVIGVGVITAAEAGLGNSLSCGLWNNCPEGVEQGFGGAKKAGKSGFSITSVTGGRSANTGTQSQPASPGGQQSPSGGGREAPSGSGDQKPPSGGENQKPPSGGGDQKPPSGGGDQKPPSGGGDQKPPSGGDGKQSPGGGEQSPSGGGGRGGAPAGKQ